MKITITLPKPTYAEYVAQQNALEAKHKELHNKAESILTELAAQLGIAPRSPIGLPAEDIRLNPTYRAAYLAAQKAFDDLRSYNGKYVKQFVKEDRAAREARYAEKLQKLTPIN